MNLLSCLRMPVDTNTWHTAIELFWNVFRGSSVFYLTKCLRCILYSFLLLLITLILLFTVHLCNKNLGLMAFLSLHVDSINIKRNFSVNFLINVVHFLTCVCFFSSLLFFRSMLLLVLSGDIETNPGPDPGYLKRFSFCYWNLNSITAHDFIKISVLNVQLHT